MSGVRKTAQNLKGTKSRNERIKKMSESYPEYQTHREYIEERRKTRRDMRRNLFTMDDYSGQPDAAFHEPGYPYNAAPNQNYRVSENFQPQYHTRQTRLDRQRRYLYGNAVSFLFFSTFLVTIWLSGPGGYFWPVWIMVPWAIGLANQVVYYWLGQRQQ
jgi:hypothetical protein